MINPKQQFARDVYSNLRNILYHSYNSDNDDLARWMTAQIMGESDWGQRPTGTYNHFGIKAKKGEPYTEVLTTEYINGVKRKMPQRFRNYDSLEDALKGYVGLLVDNYNVLDSDSLDSFTGHLKKYATNPNYAKDISNIYNGKTFVGALKDFTVDPRRKMLADQQEIRPVKITMEPSSTYVNNPARINLNRLGGKLISRKLIKLLCNNI